MEIDQQYVLPNDQIDMDVFSKKRKLQNLDEINDNTMVTHQSANKLMTNNEMSYIEDPEQINDLNDIKSVIHAKART